MKKSPFEEHLEIEKKQLATQSSHRPDLFQDVTTTCFWPFKARHPNVRSVLFINKISNSTHYVKLCDCLTPDIWTQGGDQGTPEGKRSAGICFVAIKSSRHKELADWAGGAFSQTWNRKLHLKHKVQAIKPNLHPLTLESVHGSFWSRCLDVESGSNRYSFSGGALLPFWSFSPPRGAQETQPPWQTRVQTSVSKCCQGAAGQYG